MTPSAAITRERIGPAGAGTHAALTRIQVDVG